MSEVWVPFSGCSRGVDRSGASVGRSARLLFFGGGEDLRRGKKKSPILATNHKGAVLIKWSGLPRATATVGSCCNRDLGRRPKRRKARLLSFDGAEDLRRGQTISIIGSTNHEDAVRVELSGRNAIACHLHSWPRLELHRLEIEHLGNF